MLRPTLLACLTMTALPLSPIRVAAEPPPSVMPLPASWKSGEGRLAITPAFTVAVRGHRDSRLETAVTRALLRWEARTGITFPRPFPAAEADSAALVISCDSAGSVLPALGDDESYSLEIGDGNAALHAPAVVGVIRGLETLLQLLASDSDGWYVPAMVIHDAPRFPWRGLLVDVCRHWQPMPVIKRTLDGMALAKLNVLHFHLTEDQGFRIESRTHPRLHELGSDGNYFTQDEIREIIAYAAARGIRVVPEFDIPGHATSWLVGHPEIASQPGPYEIERKWGIFDPTMDPTNEATYTLLDGFLGEMAALFPDPYMHIGGDENNGVQWNANPAIQAFIRENGLTDNHGLQAHFNRRVEAILARNDKRMLGWDEILHPDLPRNVVIHSWRGPESLAAAARDGFSGILSNGYYIDKCHPAADHYLNDPLPAETSLSLEEQARVLGGEATMWAEWVTPETIDSRIWPRTAAIGERLWSPRDVRDVDDMYRRLAIASRRLEELGLSLTRHVDFMISRLAGDESAPEVVAALRDLADLVEPVEGYQRGLQQPETTQFTPLTGLVDCARPDSPPSRLLAQEIDRALFSGAAMDMRGVRDLLNHWSGIGGVLNTEAAWHAPRVAALRPLYARLEALTAVGLEASVVLTEAQETDEAWREDQFATLREASEPWDGCKFPFAESLHMLVAAASAQGQRAGMTPEAWRNHVENLAAPPRRGGTTTAH